MFSKFLKLAAGLAAFGLALTASAQVVLLDFTDGSAPTIQTDGAWAGAESNVGTSSIFSNVGLHFYDLPDFNDSTGAYFEFTSALDLTGHGSLELIARSAVGNTGILAVTLFDSLAYVNSATALFDIAAFNGEDFRSQISALTADGSFDFSHVAAVKFGGTDINGATALNFEAARLMTPVPEPSTYAAMGAGSLVLLAGWRRRRRA